MIALRRSIPSPLRPTSTAWRSPQKIKNRRGRSHAPEGNVGRLIATRLWPFGAALCLRRPSSSERFAIYLVLSRMRQGRTWSQPVCEAPSRVEWSSRTAALPRRRCGQNGAFPWPSRVTYPSARCYRAKSGKSEARTSVSRSTPSRKVAGSDDGSPSAHTAPAGWLVRQAESSSTFVWSP